MIRFTVSDMTCGHCVETITRDLQARDPGIVLSINLQDHEVLIASSSLSPQALEDALRDTGYTPQRH
jgi:copper chaperone